MTELQPSVELFALNGEVLAWDGALGEAQLGSAQQLQILLQLAWHLRQRDTARALLLVDQARVGLSGLSLPERQRQRAGARLDLVEAESHWLFARPKPAEQLLRRALAAFELAEDRAGMADARSLLVSVFSDAGRPQERDQTLEQCLLDSRVSGDSQRLAVALARRLLFAAFRDARAAGQSLAQTEELQGEPGPGVLASLASVRAVVAGYTGELGASIGHFMQGLRGRAGDRGNCALPCFRPAMALIPLPASAIWMRLWSGTNVLCCWRAAAAGPACWAWP